LTTIFSCLDNSGQWGHGGFFKAISSLSKLPEENYALAHKMGDLKLGDVHLIRITPEQTESSTLPNQNNNTNNTNRNDLSQDRASNDQNSSSNPIDSSTLTLYVANVICQTRRSGVISPINMPKLQEALKKIAVVAKRLHGLFTIHIIYYSIFFFVSKHDKRHKRLILDVLISNLSV
jgi:hypothetical protein